MLTNLNTIFVPTDFSQIANQSLPFAAELAVQTGASLTLLYCAEEPFDFAPMVDNKKEKIIEKVTELFESISNNLKNKKKFKKTDY
ncbi:MAG: universal stress protein [Balneolaceae bacterium]|nr:universal stress protein [Balneolaceae bacterium]